MLFKRKKKEIPIAAYDLQKFLITEFIKSKQDDKEFMEIYKKSKCFKFFPVEMKLIFYGDK